MPVTAIVGANWGDEGKGRMVDALAPMFDYVVRFQGGGNAGHTVINSWGKFVLHLLPSGVFSSRTTNVIGPGVALDPLALQAELDELARRGVPKPELAISERVQLLLSHHREIDAAEERRLSTRQWGSTRSGIAPFYADKCSRLGLSADDLQDLEWLRERAAIAMGIRNTVRDHLYGLPALDWEKQRAELCRAREVLTPFLCDTTRLLRQAVNSGQEVLVEGQLGALRDADHGIYPYVTASSPLAGFAAVGAGFAPQSLRRIIAVTKAYSTCVGAGPFVTELDGEQASELRKRGGDAGEYGATTGRPRRVGWFDAVATRYGCGIQGATELALTGLDVLGYLDEIPVAVSYQIGGERCDEFPTTRRLELAKAHYERLPGWRRALDGITHFRELPANAQRYVDRVEELVNVPIRWISIGPSRESLLERNTSCL
jgi:adenylosuccinate synthase